MDSRKIILLVGALVVAAITAFMARSLISGSSAPQAQAQMAPPVVGTEVLVATKNLSGAGHPLKEGERYAEGVVLDLDYWALLPR